MKAAIALLAKAGEEARRDVALRRREVETHAIIAEQRNTKKAHKALAEYRDDLSYEERRLADIEAAIDLLAANTGDAALDAAIIAFLTAPTGDAA